jgi:hypothetical protein
VISSFELLAVPKPRNDAASAGSTDASEPPTHSHPCPCCGGRMIIIGTFERGGFERRSASGPSYRAANQIRTSIQFENGKSARFNDPRVVSDPRRRGD